MYPFNDQFKIDPTSLNVPAHPIKEPMSQKEPCMVILDTGPRELITPSPTPEHLDQHQPTNPDLDIHMLKLEPEQKILFCDHCEFSSKSENEYDNHMETEHLEEEKNKCHR